MRRAPALLATLALASLLGACSEGYPSEDQSLPSPFDMDQAQRVEVLNGLGAAARGEPSLRWRYTLEPACRLQVSQQRRGLRAAAPQVFELQRQMDVAVSFDATAQTFVVYLMSEVNPSTARRLGRLYASTAWTDAVQADLLLQLLIRDCGAGAAGADGRATPLAQTE